jgi:hypothetical protein
MLRATGINTYGRGGVTVETLFLSLKKWLSVRRLQLNAALAVLLIFTALVILYPFRAKAVSYSLLRGVVKWEIYLKTWDWDAIKGENFVLRYKSQDSDVANLVLETAEEIFTPVNEALGYTPEGPVLMVMYPDKASLNKSFGWDADENAMGVYWAGAIRILSPLAWLEDEATLAREFREQGPIAHEYTHLVVDFMTKGNYTRWLTEGVAQYMERELTGFAFASIKVAEQDKIYSFQEMTTNFDNLPDQSLAYHQSLAAIDYYVESFGFEALVNLLQELGRGKSLSQAMVDSTGLSLEIFESQVQEYIISALLKENGYFIMEPPENYLN